MRDDADAFFERYLVMFEGTSVAAAAYVVAFVITGGDVMPLAFGQNYTGLGPVIGCLAAMWALRMVQSISGMALMANGETRPLLVAGIIRASALVLTWPAVKLDLGLAGVAAAGVIGEFVAITYILVRTARGAAGIARATILRCLFPVLAGAVAAACAWWWPMTGSLLISLPVSIVLCASTILAGLAVMPRIRVFIEAQMEGTATAAMSVDHPAATEAACVSTRA